MNGNRLPTSATPNGTKAVNRPIVCYQSILVSSGGVWLGDKPLAFSLPLLLTQVTIIFTGSTLLHSLLGRLGQPKAVSQILTGIILGFSALGRDMAYLKTMFPQRSRIQLDILSEVGLMLFLFMIGVKTDLGMIRKSGKQAVALGLTSTLFPLLLMSLAGYLLRNSLPREMVDNKFVYHLAMTWSRTSYVVLSCHLAELRLLNSKVGRLAMSATLISDIFCTVLTSVYTAVQLIVSARSRMLGVGSFLSFLALVAFIVGVARPMVLWMIRRTPEGGHLDEVHFAACLGLALACGLAGELVGHHATTGTFLLGLALPGGPPLGMTLEDRLDTLMSGILVPIVLATTGFECNLFSVTDRATCGYVLLLIFIGAVAKLLGVLLPCWACGVSLPDVVALNLMMAAKGIFEAHTVNVWQDYALADKQTFSIFVVCVVGFTAVSSPILKSTYNPSVSYIAYKRRTIQHAKAAAPLRLLTCLHGQHDVGAVFNLLKFLHPSVEHPVCIYVLHLVQITGRTAARLAAYDRSVAESEDHHVNETDHIMNAFYQLEQENPSGAYVLQPFYSISPRLTMHDDVCGLALDKKISFIVLPFHEHRAIDGTIEATNAIRTMNQNVLTYAPCSVAIFIDRNDVGGAKFVPTPQLLQHLGVYFMGGPDDREALAFALRSIGTSAAVALTVVRLRLPRDWQEDTSEEAADEEFLVDFRSQFVDGERVLYREDLVRDGEETIAVIRATSHYFSLLIVGRRNGVSSPLTEGLSMWSQYPELGILGDVLASTDFGGNVSTLVVQQQCRVGMAHSAGTIKCDLNPAPIFSRFRWSKRATPLSLAVEAAV